MTVMAGIRTFAAMAITLAVMTGCSAPGSELEVADAVTVQRAGAVIHEPVYSYADHILLGLTDDQRIAGIDLSQGGANVPTTVSDPIPDAGPNPVISPLNGDTALIAQPDRGRVAEIDIGRLAVSDTIDAGPAPSYLGLNSGARVLLALSRDGSTVTPVELHQRTLLPSTVVDAGSGATVTGANRGRQLDFHVIGRDRVAYYKGHTPPAQEKGDLGVSVAAAAGDGAKVTRVYLAERGTDRLLAVDAQRGGEGLHVVGTAAVGEQIRYLATDDTRIYAVTDQHVVVLETRSFEGYADRVIPVVRTLDFRSAVPDGPAESAPVSGIAVGNDRVFLTLSGQPYIIGVAKPRL
ncbi:hypothetical protein [Nocardia brevicatena]|uniref:hypothetical protein n=1 Tax=Nocardia brevicatena TaxID=37327 RepID=UPI0012FCFE60|nr:hypothetical protein [Nocardia brevicatena]